MTAPNTTPQIPSRDDPGPTMPGLRTTLHPDASPRGCSSTDRLGQAALGACPVTRNWRGCNETCARVPHTRSDDPGPELEGAPPRLPDTDRLRVGPGTTTPPPGTRCPVTGSAKAPRGRRPARRSRRGPRSAGARPPHRRRRASGSTPPAPPPAAPGSCAGAGTGRFLLPRRCVQRREHSRHRPVSRSSAHGPCRSPGRTPSAASSRGFPAHTQTAVLPAEVTHRRPGNLGAVPLPSSHHQQPAPDLTTAAWDRRSPPTAFVASTGARAGVAGRSGPAGLDRRAA